MIRRPPRSTQSRSSAASDVYKRQSIGGAGKVGTRAPCERCDDPSRPSYLAPWRWSLNWTEMRSLDDVQFGTFRETSLPPPPRGVLTSAIVSSGVSDPDAG